MEESLYVYMPGIALSLAFFSSSEKVVRISSILADCCLLKVHRPLDVSSSRAGVITAIGSWGSTDLRMVHLGQDQVEEIGGSFCCVIWTGLSELAKLIEQLVTAEGGNLPPAAFPSLIVTTA